MIADVLLFCGVFGGLLTLLDMLMNDKQKANLSLFIIGVWQWSDTFTKTDFLTWVRNRWFFRVFFVLSAFVAISVYLILGSFVLDASNMAYVGPDYKTHAKIAGGILAAFCIGQFLVRLSLNAKTVLGLIATSSGMLLVAGLLYVIGERLDTRIAGEYTAPAITPDDVLSSLWVVLAALLGLFWIACVVPITASLSLSFVLRGIELILRRIGESSKGPLLAVSALSGALAAVLKIFS